MMFHRLSLYLLLCPYYTRPMTAASRGAETVRKITPAAWFWAFHKGTGTVPLPDSQYGCGPRTLS